MANPAAAAQHPARGGDGAAGRPATERAQGTGSPRLRDELVLGNAGLSQQLTNPFVAIFQTLYERTETEVR